MGLSQIETVSQMRALACHPLPSMPPLLEDIVIMTSCGRAGRQKVGFLEMSVALLCSLIFYLATVYSVRPLAVP